MTRFFVAILAFSCVAAPVHVEAQDESPRVIAMYALDSYVLVLWGENMRSSEPAFRGIAVFATTTFPPGESVDSVDLSFRGLRSQLEDSPPEIILLLDQGEERVFPASKTTT